jgi:hypothetical protein
VWPGSRPGRFTPGKDPISIVQDAGWAPGPDMSQKPPKYMETSTKIPPSCLIKQLSNVFMEQHEFTCRSSVPSGRYLSLFPNKVMWFHVFWISPPSCPESLVALDWVTVVFDEECKLRSEVTYKFCSCQLRHRVVVSE